MVSQKDLQNVVNQVNSILTDLDKRVKELEAKLAEHTARTPQKKAAASK